MLKADIEIREMTLDDYEAVVALWEKTPGVKLSPEDSREGIERYLIRNPGLSWVAVCENRIVGSLLGGTDGRRGYLQHMSVEDRFREQGVGTAMVEKAKQAFRALEIRHLRIFVLRDNATGKAYWEKRDWRERLDIQPMDLTDF